MNIICPNCKKSINNAYAYYLEENKYYIHFGSSKDRLHLFYDESEVIESTEERVQVVCPHCEHVLYSSKDVSENKIRERLSKYQDLSLNTEQ